jgi:acyl-CoA thioesterase FadM
MLTQVEQSHGIWHSGVHYVASEVRDYELDQFQVGAHSQQRRSTTQHVIDSCADVWPFAVLQVVNNAVYASYVQHGEHSTAALTSSRAVTAGCGWCAFVACAETVFELPAAADVCQLAVCQPSVLPALLPLTHPSPFTLHPVITGRHKAFSSLGVSVGSFQQAGTLMALSELSLQYKAPLRAGDVFYITTAVAQVRSVCVAV